VSDPPGGPDHPRGAGCAGRAPVRAGLPRRGRGARAVRRQDRADLRAAPGQADPAGNGGQGAEPAQDPMQPVRRPAALRDQRGAARWRPRAASGARSGCRRSA
jgi:hypothetical protein